MERKRIKAITKYYQQKLFNQVELCVQAKTYSRTDPSLVDVYEEALHSLYIMLPPDAQADINQYFDVEEILDKINSECSKVLANDGVPVHRRIRECASIKKYWLDKLFHALMKAIHEHGLSMKLEEEREVE